MLGLRTKRQKRDKRENGVCVWSSSAAMATKVCSLLLLPLLLLELMPCAQASIAVRHRSSVIWVLSTSSKFRIFPPRDSSVCFGVSVFFCHDWLCQRFANGHSFGHDFFLEEFLIISDMKCFVELGAVAMGMTLKLLTGVNSSIDYSCVCACFWSLGLFFWVKCSVVSCMTRWWWIANFSCVDMARKSTTAKDAIMLSRYWQVCMWNQTPISLGCSTAMR